MCPGYKPAVRRWLTMGRAEHLGAGQKLPTRLTINRFLMLERYAYEMVFEQRTHSNDLL